jgi:hypothetical protein
LPAVLGLVTVLGAGVAACAGPHSATGPTAPLPPAPTAGTSADCRPYDPPRSLADIDATVSGYRDVPEFRGGDVGADVTLQDGRRAWVFGDTLRADGFGASTVVRNSMVLFGTGCVTTVIPAGRGALVPDRPDGVGYWPMSLQTEQHPGYDLLRVFYQRVRGSEQATEFSTLGPALAVFRVDRGGLPRLRKVTDLGPDQADQSARTWGAASWADGGYVYVYGTANPRTPGVFGYGLAVARARPDTLADQATWQYWDGATWQADAGRAAQLIDPRGGVSQTLSVLRQGDRWYAVSKRDDFLGSDLVIWDAPGPAGPFHANRPVAAIPSTPDRHLYLYMPLAHPDLLPQPGTLVVSVCRNSDDLATLMADPLLYRPHFLRVPLP